MFGCFEVNCADCVAISKAKMMDCIAPIIDIKKKPIENLFDSNEHKLHLLWLVALYVCYRSKSQFEIISPAKLHQVRGQAVTSPSASLTIPSGG